MLSKEVFNIIGKRGRGENGRAFTPHKLHPLGVHHNNIIDRLCYSTPEPSHKAPKLTTINRDSVRMGQTLATTTVIGGRSSE